MGSVNGGPGVGVGVEREWKSHVEGREKSRWERKKQIVSHCATSVSGRHCRVCVEDFCSRQLGMGSRLMGWRGGEGQLLPVWKTVTESRREDC